MSDKSRTNFKSGTNMECLKSKIDNIIFTELRKYVQRGDLVRLKKFKEMIMYMEHKFNFIQTTSDLMLHLGKELSQHLFTFCILMDVDLKKRIDEL